MLNCKRSRVQDLNLEFAIETWNDLTYLLWKNIVMAPALTPSAGNDFSNQLFHFHFLASKMQHSVPFTLEEPNPHCCVGVRKRINN